MTTPDQPAATSTDLVTRTDIHDLVVAFYREVIFDELLDPLFTEVAEVDWSTHIPTLIDYWCGILLGLPKVGGVVAAHRRVHAAVPITSAHCDRWYALWVDTIDTSWAGPTAERAKAHAAAMMSGLAHSVFNTHWTAPTNPQADHPSPPIGTAAPP